MVDLDTVLKEDLAIPERDLPVTITYKVHVSSVYDPSTGTTVNTYESYSLTCLRGAVNNEEIQIGGGVLGLGDSKFYIRDEEMTDNWTDNTPRNVDKIVWETKSYNLLRWIESPDGHLWTIYARRGEAI